MKDILTLIKESIFIGISLTIVFIIVANIFKRIFKYDIIINRQTIFILFLSVVILHFIFEVTNINKKYADNYYK